MGQIKWTKEMLRRCVRENILPSELTEEGNSMVVIDQLKEAVQGKTLAEMGEEDALNRT